MIPPEKPTTKAQRTQKNTKGTGRKPRGVLGVPGGFQTGSEKALLASIGLSAGALALGYGLGGQWPGVVLAVSLGGLWWLNVKSSRDWLASALLLVVVALAAAGLWLDLDAGWLLAGLVGALCAWDLDHWVRQLRGVEWDEPSAARRLALEKEHLRRLAAVAGVGLVLGLLALVVHVRLSFFLAVLLGLLIAWGLSRAVTILRRESD
jgi:hypothetical protein